MKPGDPAPLAVEGEGGFQIYRTLGWMSNQRAFIEGTLFGYQLRIKQSMLTELEVEKEAQEEVKRRGG